MIVFPKAKINLGLNITGKRPDGYHDIETIFYRIGLSDALEFVVSDNTADKDILSTTGINTGDKFSPLPEAKEGAPSIKNGQSLPSSSARFLSSRSEISSSKYLLIAFNKYAESDDPPPRPAPTGITL